MKAGEQSSMSFLDMMDDGDGGGSLGGSARSHGFDDLIVK